MTARTIPLLGLLLVGLACATPLEGGAAAQRVRFESGVGSHAFELRRSAARVTLRNAEGRALVSVLRQGDAWQVEDSEGRQVGRVRRIARSSHPRFALSGRRDASGNLELKVEKDGDLEIKDSEGRTLFKLKQREYGFKIVDGEGRTIGRVRLSSSGKLSVRDENDLTYLSTRDAMPIEAATVLMVPGLDLQAAAGLAAIVWHWREESS